MKKLIFLGSISLITFFSKSQSLGINNTGAAGDASSILDLSSTSKGLLIPRMNQTQRNAISSPATGLMIYQTDNTPGFYFYDGTSWKRTATSDNASYTAGTGISISSNTITNTAPDQTVTLTNGTGISVTGTYPNFTITNSSPSSGGTVTSVGLSTGTTGTDVNISNSPITSSGLITLNIPTASATNRGALSSTDWSTFNGKENALTFSSPLSRTSNTISLGTVGVANGGTGQTTYTDGQLLIGNTTGNTLTKATLTAGTGIAITNGNGSISIATTGAAPTGSAGGDLSGTYPNPIVSKINGVALGTTTATSGNLLIANGTTWGTTAMSGDATINSAGALSIGNGAVTSAKIADGTIAAGDLSSMSATSGQVLKYNGTAWAPAADNNAGGTVTSVGLSLPSIFSVTNSPITTSGTLTGSLATQSANTVFAGPSTGAAAAPAFRALVAGDIPTLNQNTTGSAGSVANALTFNNGGSGAASGTTFNGSSVQTISYNTIGAVGGSGTTTQAAYFNASNTLTSSSAVTIQPNTATTTSGSLAVTSNSTTANTQAIYGSATGAAQVYGVFGTTSSTTTNATGIRGVASGTSGAVNGVWGSTPSTTGYGVFGESTAASGTSNGVVGAASSSSGTGVWGIASGIASGTSTYGVYGQATGAGSAASSFNFGVRAIADNNTSLSIGVRGSSSTAGMIGVQGLFSGTSTGGGTGISGANTSSGGTSTTAILYGVSGSATGTQGATGQTHIGVNGSASGSSYNVAGYFGGGGEVVLPYLAAGTTRLWNGSLYVANNQSRLYWTGNNGTAVYVNSSGAGDYSEFFRTSDNTMSIGEVVSINPELANGVRRSRPSDAPTLVGVVSQFGTQNNDDPSGGRLDDSNYVNVGMLGQLPVLVTTENGPIKPGDPLTTSPTIRGRATKAIGPCRIIGFATTHFPYIDGEKTSLDDSRREDAVQLKGDHVMCYLNIGWYEPTEILGEGIEPPKEDETVWETKKRIQEKKEKDYLSSEMYKREKRLKEDLQNKLNQAAMDEPKKINKEHASKENIKF